MSIPTIFTNANCQTQIPGELNGGGMLQFCRTFKAGMPGVDVCEINTQEDYNEYQLGCVNGRHGTFIDNNNNTVKLEFNQNYIPVLDAAIEFPIGSHNNLHTLSPPQQGYVEPYPIFVTQDNCRDSRTTFTMCCPARPAWSIEETVPKPGECVLIDDSALGSFGKCCVSSLHGTYVNPIDGSVTKPETTNDPVTELPTGDSNNEGSTYPESTYPESTYPESTYPESTYPESTYLESTYPESTYPETTFTDSGSTALDDINSAEGNTSELQDLGTKDNDSVNNDNNSELTSEKSSASVMTKRPVC